MGETRLRFDDCARINAAPCSRGETTALYDAMNAFDPGRLGGFRPLVSMTAGPFHQFRATRPSGSRCGGLDVPDELLGVAGRNRTIGAATVSQISSGASNRTIGGPIDAPTGDTITYDIWDQSQMTYVIWDPLTW